LGRMLAASASLLNVRVVVLEEGENAPAKQIVSPPAAHLAHVDGSYADPKKIEELAKKVDVLTIEIEHVDAAALEQVERSMQATGLVVHPSASTIKTIQDKFLQKEHLAAHDLPVSKFMAVESTVQAVVDAAEKFGLPLMLKSRTLAYDGRGNRVLRNIEEAQAAIDFLSHRPLYAEKWVQFTKEIAVLVVKSATGEIASYPAVETIHKDNICHLVFAPLRTQDHSILHRARTIAESAVRTFTGAGVFAVEMFLMVDGSLPL